MRNYSRGFASLVLVGVLLVMGMVSTAHAQLDFTALTSELAAVATFVAAFAVALFAIWGIVIGIKQVRGAKGAG